MAAADREVKMVVVDGVRFRPEDAPDKEGKRPARKAVRQPKNKGIGIIPDKDAEKDADKGPDEGSKDE